MKEYFVKTTTVGGNVNTFNFTNKREAKSFAYKWINDKKRIHREKSNDKDYQCLSAIIFHWNSIPDETTLEASKVTDAVYC